jgi:hypothetical protein
MIAPLAHQTCLQLRQRIGERGVIVGGAHAVEGAVRRQTHADARGRKDGGDGRQNLGVRVSACVCACAVRWRRGSVRGKET